MGFVSSFLTLSANRDYLHETFCPNALFENAFHCKLCCRGLTALLIRKLEEKEKEKIDVDDDESQSISSDDEEQDGDGDNGVEEVKLPDIGNMDSSSLPLFIHNNSLLTNSSEIDGYELPL